jgi:hypothetical protein
MIQGITVTAREYFIAELEKLTGEKHDYTDVPTSKIYSALQLLKPVPNVNITGVSGG